MPETARGRLVAALAVPALAVLWGLNWPAVRIVLGSWSPFALRLVGLGLGASLLFGLARLRGQPLRIEPAYRVRLVVSALLTIVGFTFFTAFAQLAGSTSRAAIVTFTMPIWAVLLAWPLLGERPDRWRIVAIVTGVAGLSLLALPLFADGVSLHGPMLALAAGVSWAAGTVFVKRWPVRAPALASTAWQLTLGAGVAALCLAVLAVLAAPATFSTPSPLPAQWPSSWFLIALVFHVVFATAIAYVIWFDVVARLPAGVAAMGTLFVPVVGVLGAMLLLGERPDATDIGGFALIISAAALALLAPRVAA